MLESYRGSNKKHKTKLINIEGQNSYKELIGKTKIMIKRKRADRNKTKKELKISDNIEEEKGEKKTKFSLGEIKIAKIHKEANRPLKQIKDLTIEEIKNNSCPCCGLPTKIKGKLEDYKICNSPDEFTNCGDGVVLYFSFFKFCMIVTFIAALGIGCFGSYISYNYYNELQEFCDNLPIINETDVNLTTPSYYSPPESLSLSDVYYKCEIYSKPWLLRKGAIHNETILFNSFFFKLSLVHFRNYEDIPESLNHKIEGSGTKSQNINLNLVNFICLINIFIAYLAYIFFIYNKSNALNYSVYTIGDYSIMMINLDDIYEKFEENLAYIQNKEDEFSNSYQKLDFKLYEEKLGFEPDKNMSKLNLFKKFLEKKLFINYNIKRIDLCYKLNEIIYLQKSLEELDEKIERIEFDQSMIEKNNKKGIKGDKRIYFSYLCCEESLESIKTEKKDKEKKLNELIESSKENNNFCGVAFATFNTIKEQEDYLHKKKISCCSSDKNEDALSPYERIIFFERAPEPEDIIFENFKHRFQK